MLWSVILPFRITVGLWTVVFVGVWCFAPRLGYRRVRIVLLTMLLALLLFIPSCATVQYVVDAFRFGMFQHADFDSVNDWRVERYLPDAATDITLEKPAHSNGFRAKYSVPKAELEKWLDDIWAKCHDRSQVTREEAQEIQPSADFDDLGWPPLKDAVRHEGPREDDWGGFVIWYSESTGIAYEDAAYW